MLYEAEYGSVAVSLSDVFPEERRKVGCADGGGTGSFVGHERCGGRSLRRNGRRRDLEEVIQRVLPRVLEETGTQSSCAGITRSDSEHSNVTGNRNHDMGESKGSKKSKSKGRNKREFKCCYECGKFGLGVRSREAVRWRSIS